MGFEMKALSASHILSICDDPILVESRELVLRYAGYSVQSTRSDADPTKWSDKSIDLVLLCHTVDENHSHELIRRLRRFFPEAGIIQVDILADRRGMPVDGQCTVEDGPNGLLQSVEAVLDQARLAPPSSA
jgi:hypothetical protein